jgi:hypothetical protein
MANYGRKKFYNIGRSGNIIKLFITIEEANKPEAFPLGSLSSLV